MLGARQNRCLTFADCRLQTADCRLQTADYRLQTADCRLQITDCIQYTLGCRLNKTLAEDRCSQILKTAELFNPTQILVILKLWLFGHVNDDMGMC